MTAACTIAATCARLRGTAREHQPELDRMIVDRLPAQSLDRIQVACSDHLAALETVTRVRAGDEPDLLLLGSREEEERHVPDCPRRPDDRSGRDDAESAFARHG